MCGAVIFVAANLQQFGIENGTTAGKSGFITALYVVMVPIVSVFLKRKPPKTIWIGIVLARDGTLSALRQNRRRKRHMHR